MISASALALLSTLAGDAHAPGASTATLSKTYDITAALPWRAPLDVKQPLLPYFEREVPDASVEIDALAGADAVIQILRTITGKEFEYEGREISVDDSGRLLVKAPATLHELTERYLSFLENAVGAASELSIDVFTLPDSAKDVAVQGLVPVSDIARFAAAAEQGGSRHTYRLELRTGATARLDATRATTLVSDYDIEIAQASTIADPVVDTIALGTRVFARAAPAPGGTWLALILAHGEQVGDVETHDLPFEFMINTQERPNFVAAPHLFQSVDVENRSFALNTFIPDGKALVVRTSHECKNARPTEIVVVRQTGRALPSAQRFQIDPKNPAKGDDILLFDTRAAVPPRCAIWGQLLDESWRWSAFACLRGQNPLVVARFADEHTDAAIKMLEPLDAWGRVDSLGSWILLAKDPGRAGADSTPPGLADDTLATLARCAPRPQLVQVSIALKLNVTPSVPPDSATAPSPVVPTSIGTFKTIARCLLPLRAGAASCAIIGRENSEVFDYDVQVAQLAAGADPKSMNTFDGLALVLKPDIASSGDVALDVSVRAHVKRGDTREFDPHVQTLGRMQQSTYDQLDTHEKLVFAKSDGGPRRMVLGDAASGPGSLSLEIEIVP